MKIFELCCDECGAAYAVAESDREPGAPCDLRCAICGSVFASRQEPKLRVARLLSAPDKAPFHSPVSTPLPLI